jgi:hypothetical protein
MANSFGLRLVWIVPVPAALFSDNPVVWTEGQDMDACHGLSPQRSDLGSTCEALAGVLDDVVVMFLAHSVQGARE